MIIFNNKISLPYYRLLPCRRYEVICKELLALLSGSLVLYCIREDFKRKNIFAL